MKRIFINKQNKLRSGWKIILLFIAIFGFQFLVSIVTGLVIGLLAINNQTDYREMVSAVSSYMKYITSISSIIIVWLFFKLIEKKTLSESGFSNLKSGFRDLFSGLILGAISMSAIFFLLLGTKNIGLEGSLLSPSYSTYLWSGLILFILVGFEEEYIFRGYVMNALSQTGSKGSVFIVSAIIFSLAHGLNPNVSAVGLLNIFLVGLLFAYMFYETKSLWMPIGYHITWNYFQGSIFGFPVSGTKPEGLYNIINVEDNLMTGGGFGPEGGIFATAAIILGALFVYVYSRYRKERCINCSL